MSHKSVLLKEVLDGLQIKKGDVFVDATLGSAGHSLAISDITGVKIIGIDADMERIKESKEKLKEKAIVIEENFRNIDKVLDTLKIQKVDKILFDLGLNSEQLENSGRGFSFQKNEPLLMNFNENPLFTAKEIVNEWSEESIKDILWGYGEEKFSKEIASKITLLRKEKEIETTKDLVDIIEKAVPNWYKHKKIHFATKTFQALRMAVNDEVKSLEEGMEKGFERLKEGGRLGIISFHGIEDRLVKRYFKKLKEGGRGVWINKKVISPTREEIRENRRARSAKLRIIEKI